MNCFRKMCLIISFVALGGCATVPTKHEMQQANYGTQISKSEFESAVRNGSGFLDPYSAMIGCTDPKKGWEQDVLEPMKFGYIAQCSVNAKNRMGGYVGTETRMYILSNNLLYPIRLYNRNWGFLNSNEAMVEHRKPETASNTEAATVVTNNGKPAVVTNTILNTTSVGADKIFMVDGTVWEGTITYITSHSVSMGTRIGGITLDLKEIQKINFSDAFVPENTEDLANRNQLKTDASVLLK